MQRTLVTVLAALLATAVFAGCLTPEDDATPKQGENVIIYGTTDTLDNMDPAIPFSYFDDSVLFPNIFDTLLTYKPGTTDLQPHLAENWTVSDDGLTYTFDLQDNATFVNGNPVTAEDVKFSFDRVSQETIANQAVQGNFLTTPIKEVRAVNNDTVEIELNETFSAFPFSLTVQTFSIVDDDVYQMNQVRSGFNNDFPVGSGPFEVTDFRQGESITLEPNENYWGGAPANDGVVIRFFTDAASLKSAVESGEVDIAYRTFQPTQFNDLADRQDQQPWTTTSVEAPVIRYMVFQQNVEPFDDVHVRRAIAAAIDRQAIVDQVFLGTASPLYSLIPDGLDGHTNAFQEEYGEGPNLDLAMQELQAAGYSEQNPLQIPLWYTPTHYGDTEDEVAQVLKQQLENTGAIQVTLQSKEWEAYIDDFVNGQLGLYLLGWFPDYVDADDYVYPFLKTPEAEQATGVRIQDNATEFNQLLDQERSQPIDERNPTFEQIQALLAESAPYVPMWQENQNVVVGDDVSGFNLGPDQIVRLKDVSRGGS